MKLIGLQAALLIFASTGFANDTVTDTSTATEVSPFAGSWTTDFGVMDLTQNGDSVQGRYPTGNVNGAVKNGVLTLRYRDASTTGDAKFTLSEDGSTFNGAWREDGTNSWLQWNGRRRAVKKLGFDGLYETSFGPMRLTNKDGEVQGAYEYQSGISTIEGQIKENRLIFRYKEPEAEGWFELSNDGMSIHGKWRPDGAPQWRSWTGKRKTPQAGRVWLVILEANWERSIEEPQYAFGHMLDSYFTMASARHIEVRHRFFHDATDLSRFCRKVQFLAEPVVLLISTHGTPDGITVFGKTITANVIAESLANASNVKLLHLSGCAMMSGAFPNQIHTLLEGRGSFPISGYKTPVAWDASALGDFTFLSLVLIRRLEPEAAARQAMLLSPYLSDDRVPGSVFRPLGLTVLRSPTVTANGAARHAKPEP